MVSKETISLILSLGIKNGFDQCYEQDLNSNQLQMIHQFFAIDNIHFQLLANVENMLGPYSMSKRIEMKRNPYISACQF